MNDTPQHEFHVVVVEHIFIRAGVLHVLQSYYSTVADLTYELKMLWIR